jgi:GT2 family glycosyltransferase
MREAFSAADCHWYVCVNPDAMLHPRCIFELIQAAEREPKAGLVEARLFPDEHPKQYDPTTLNTPWCSGCVLLVTRALYETIGGFDENFFMYCEDVDLSWRAHAAGFRTLIAPGALVHHYAQGRPILRERELAVRRSAAYLATKYGATEFAGRMLREYESLGGPSFELPKASPKKAPRGSFDHLLRFSASRW